MRAAIFGATGGLGRAFCNHLLADPRFDTVYGLARGSQAEAADVRYRAIELDLLDEAALSGVAADMRAEGPLDLIIIATGLLSDDEGLQPEKSWRDQSLPAFEKIFAVNTFAPALIAKHFLPLLARKQRAVFAALSARVGSISDNRLGGWHAYRASKAALNMLVRNYALELARRNENAICVALHPGTVQTNLSAPFTTRGNRILFTPEEAARHLLGVMAKLEPEQSGRQFDWAGQEIPA